MKPLLFFCIFSLLPFSYACKSKRKDPDVDQDGLTLSQETELGTDPENADSDGDGLTDGDEVLTHQTHPLDDDSDDDGLLDGQEVLRDPPTDPNDSDSDNDGLSDGEEVAIGTNPLSRDSDDDGLTDSQEIEAQTHPLDDDSDDDGLLDGQEVLTDWTDPLDAGNFLEEADLADDCFLLSNNQRWTCDERSARITSEANESFRILGELRATPLNINNPPLVASLRKSPDESLLQFEPVDIGNNILWSRRIDMLSDEQSIRVLDTFVNSSGVQASTTIELLANLKGVYEGAKVHEANSEVARGIVLDDPDPFGENQAIHFWFGPASAPVTLPFSEIEFTGGDKIGADLRIALEPGETKRVVAVFGQFATRHEATRQLSTLNRNTRFVLDGIPLQARRQIVNVYPDTDLDGYSDVEEEAAGTDPNSSDTDGDTLTDLFEATYPSLNPTEANDPTADTDGDGLSSLEEQEAGTNPEQADSDDDDLSDFEEIRAGGTGTLPTEADTDGDGLEDGLELNVNQDPDAVVTNPLLADTDGGGRSDGEERLQDATDPRDGRDDLQWTPLLGARLSPGGIVPWSFANFGDLFRTLSGGNKAFQFAADIYKVNGSFRDFHEPLFGQLSPDESQLLTNQVEMIPGVQLRRSFYAPIDARWIRIEEQLTNTTDTDINFEIAFLWNITNNVNAEVIQTSSGDETLDAEDDWFVVDDGDALGRRQAVYALYSGPMPQSEASHSGFNVTYHFNITLAPGETKRLAQFVGAHETRQDAIDEVGTLLADPQIWENMTDEARRQVVNFNAAP